MEVQGCKEIQTYKLCTCSAKASPLYPGPVCGMLQTGALIPWWGVLTTKDCVYIVLISIEWQALQQHKEQRADNTAALQLTNLSGVASVPGIAECTHNSHGKQHLPVVLIPRITLMYTLAVAGSGRWCPGPGSGQRPRSSCSQTLSESLPLLLLLPKGLSQRLLTYSSWTWGAGGRPPSAGVQRHVIAHREATDESPRGAMACGMW
mgnify:CR=1 FL=1